MPEHLNLEIEQLGIFPTLVIPQSSVAIETPISHIQPSKIYFGPNGEVLPPSLIAIEEIPQPDTPLSPTHFEGDLYLYYSFPQFFPSNFVDPIAIQSLVDFEEYTFGHTTTLEPKSSVGSSVPITSSPTLTIPLMFTTSIESYLHSGPVLLNLVFLNCFHLLLLIPLRFNLL